MSLRWGESMGPLLVCLFTARLFTVEGRLLHGSKLGQ